jgi:hypothetical protein
MHVRDVSLLKNVTEVLHGHLPGYSRSKINVVDSVSFVDESLKGGMIGLHLQRGQRLLASPDHNLERYRIHHAIWRIRKALSIRIAKEVWC